MLCFAWLPRFLTSMAVRWPLSDSDGAAARIAASFGGNSSTNPPLRLNRLQVIRLSWFQRRGRFVPWYERDPNIAWVAFASGVSNSPARGLRDGYRSAHWC